MVQMLREATSTSVSVPSLSVFIRVLPRDDLAPFLRHEILPCAGVEHVIRDDRRDLSRDGCELLVGQGQVLALDSRHGAETARDDVLHVVPAHEIDTRVRLMNLVRYRR